MVTNPCIASGGVSTKFSRSKVGIASHKTSGRTAMPAPQAHICDAAIERCPNSAHPPTTGFRLSQNTSVQTWSTPFLSWHRKIRRFGGRADRVGRGANRRKEACAVQTARGQPPAHRCPGRSAHTLPLAGSGLRWRACQLCNRTLCRARHGLRPEDLFVNLVEVARENWSFGNGIAQCAT